MRDGFIFDIITPRLLQISTDETAVHIQWQLNGLRSWIRIDSQPISIFELRRTNAGDTTWKLAIFRKIPFLGLGSNIAAPYYSTIATFVDTNGYKFTIVVPPGSLSPNTEMSIVVVDKSKEASPPPDMEMINDMLMVVFTPSVASASLDTFTLTWVPVAVPVPGSRRYVILLFFSILL